MDDGQPVLSALAETVARVCHPAEALVYRVEGDRLRLVARHGARRLPTGSTEAHPIARRTARGRALLDGRTSRAGAAVATPMLRDGVPVGIIEVRRGKARPLSSERIGLIEALAVQAAVTIQELDARSRELVESLEQQAATAEILRVISSSPADVQPVFDTIAAHALKLCGALWSAVLRFDGDLLHLASLHNLSDPVGIEAVRRAFPRPPSPGGATDRAILTRAVAYIRDVREDPGYRHRGMAQAANYLSHLSVPMLREGQPVGAITVAGASAGAFSERQVKLLQTFADHAVIAIENVRVFRELGARNRDLTEALEQQTATGEILRVISRSPTDVQPVFDALARSAARLCEAELCFVYRFDGELLHFVAHHGLTPEGYAALRRVWPLAPSPGTAAGRSIIGPGVAHIPDVQADPGYVLGTVAGVAAFRAPWQSRCCATGSRSDRSPSREREPGPLRTGRSSSSRPSPTRRSSPSRTCACSRRCRRATVS